MQEHQLAYEAPGGQAPLQVSNTLPPEVVQCLKNARFLHLATCIDLQPHVSLMNYTYLPSNPYTPFPTIIMTTNPSSKKTYNIVSNPNVSLLVHDWVSHRPPITTPSAHQNGRAGSPPAETSQSSLATLLANLNTSALSSISATINGTARLVERGTEEEEYLRQKHLENNTFDDGERRDSVGAGSLQGSCNVGGEAENGYGDGGRGCFIEGEEVRVVVVRVMDGRVADWKGEVRDWCLSSEENRRGDGTLVNGV